MEALFWCITRRLAAPVSYRLLGPLMSITVTTFNNCLYLLCICRTATARGKAEQADIAAVHAREDAQLAIGVSQAFGGTVATAAEEKHIATTTSEVAKPASDNLLTVKNHNNAAAASTATAAAAAAKAKPPNAAAATSKSKEGQ